MKDHTNRFNSPPCAADELDTGKGRVTQFSDLSPSLILFLLSASVGVAMTGLGIIWPLVPVYAVQLGASGLQVGLIIAAFNITRTLFNPFSGRFSDRWGRKPFIVSGLFLYSVVSVLYVLSTQVEMLIFVRLLHGFTSVLVVPVAMALAADIAPQRQLGLYMGTLNMAVMLGLGVGSLLGLTETGWSLGMTISPIISGIIMDSLGVPTIFFTGGLLTITGTILIYFFLFNYIPPKLSSPASS